MTAQQKNVRRGLAKCGLPHAALGRHLCVRHGICRVGCWAFLLLLAAPAFAERDPFWPIGYAPPEAAVQKPVKPAEPERRPEPPKPDEPPEAPITEDDWKQARALITVSGFTQSRHPVSGETRTVVMINRNTFTEGNTLAVTNAGALFFWSIESLAGLKLTLKPIRADRLPPPALPAH